MFSVSVSVSVAVSQGIVGTKGSKGNQVSLTVSGWFGGCVPTLKCVYKRVVMCLLFRDPLAPEETPDQQGLQDLQ